VSKNALCRLALFVGGISIALFGLPPLPVDAGNANCWANVICSFPGGSTYTNTQSWPNGSWPFSAREWSECRDNCNGYIAGLDLQGMAKERNVCGTVECSATYWLGARPARADCGPRRVQVACTGPDPAQNTDSQYAAKFVCGPAATNPLVEDGDYKTTINVHNPQYQPVGFRYKAALAGIAADGSVSSFVTDTIGPDAVQGFDCDVIRKLLGGSPPPLIDGFLVFQSNSPLDVTGYYTATRPAQNGTAIHIEKYPARAVPAYDPLCKKDTKIDLADVKNWQTSAANLAVTVSPAQLSWDTGRSWMSYQADANPPNNVNTNFTYQLDFCSCVSAPAQGPPNVRVSGDVKSDNAANGELNITLSNSPQTIPIFDTGTPSFPNGNGNFFAGDLAVPILKSISMDAGSGNILITVHNISLVTGVSVIGSLNLTEGHVGACRQ
jgi:hypothetical protein